LILPPRAASIGALLVAISIGIGASVTFIGEPQLDHVIVEHAAELRDGGWYYDLLAWLSDVGYARWLIPAGGVIALMYGIVLHRWRAALVVALSTPVAALGSRTLKESFERARPADGVDVLVAGFSMPSGHATSSAAFAASVIIVLAHARARRIAIVVLALFALLVGVSRVVLGAHYPSDVIAGFCLGTGVALLVAVAVCRIPHPRSTVRDPGPS
jgi:undecaprenyl-diphosphatase